MGQIQSVPNLIQGVSQQSAQQRRDSQCEEQFDCINSPLNGCEARPPTEFVKLWPGRNIAGAFFHEVVRGTENYITGVHNGQPFAIDLADGTDCGVALETPTNYLASATPRQSLRAQSVEDTTILLNREVRPSMQTFRSVKRPPEAIVFVRAPAFDTTYTVTVGGAGGSANASYKTLASDKDNAGALAATTYIAAILAQGLNQNGYFAEVAGSSIRVYRPDGQDFAIATSDGNGDDFMYAFKDTVAAYSRLPRKGFTGVEFKVKGESRTEADDFYVRFDGTSSTGAWVEGIGPNVRRFVEGGSMPHLLVQTGYRQFAFRRAPWSSRIVGDETSAKDPGFMGKVLKDVFYHQGRLALLHEAGCVWSKTRFPYTFFPDTVQTVLATAPVDYTLAATSSTKGAALLDFGVQVDEALYLWAPRAQFRVSSGSDPFKQDTVEAPLTSAFEYATQCDPLALGQLLYFATEAGRSATIRSLQFAQGRALGDIDVTSHVATYIPTGVKGLVASDTLRCMFVYSAGDPGGLYLYNYLLQERDYAQSAWNRWRLYGGELLWVGLQDNALSILQQRPEGLALLRVNLTSDLVDPIEGAEYRTRLDHLVNEEAVTVAYDEATGESTITLPYIPVGVALRVVLRADGGGFTRGREFTVLAKDGFTARVKGDLRGLQFYAGEPIESVREESRFYLRSEQGVVPNDRLTVERFRLETSDTGYTRIEVRPAKGAMKATEFEGRRLGTETGRSGTPKPSAAVLDAPVGHLAGEVKIRLVNDSFLPSRWQTAAYEYAAVGKSGVR